MKKIFEVDIIEQFPLFQEQIIFLKNIFIIKKIFSHLTLVKSISVIQSLSLSWCSENFMKVQIIIWRSCQKVENTALLWGLRGRMKNYIMTFMWNGIRQF